MGSRRGKRVKGAHDKGRNAENKDITCNTKFEGKKNKKTCTRRSVQPYYNKKVL